MTCWRLAGVCLVQVLLFCAQMSLGQQADLFGKNSTSQSGEGKMNTRTGFYYRNGQVVLYCKNVACPSVGNLFYTYSCCDDKLGRKNAACCVRLTTTAKLIVALSTIVAILIFSLVIVLSLRIGKYRRRKKCNRGRRKGSSGNPSLTNYKTHGSMHEDVSLLQAGPQTNGSGPSDSELTGSFRMETDAGVMSSSRLSKSLTDPNSKGSSRSASAKEANKAYANVTEEKAVSTKQASSSVAGRSDGATCQGASRGSKVLSTVSKQEDLQKLCPPKRIGTQGNGNSLQQNTDHSTSSLSLPPLENLLPVHESTHNRCLPNVRTAQTNKPSFLATGSMLGSEPSAENSGHKSNDTQERQDFSVSLPDMTSDSKTANRNISIEVPSSDTSANCSTGKPPNMPCDSTAC